MNFKLTLKWQCCKPKGADSIAASFICSCHVTIICAFVNCTTPLIILEVHYSDVYIGMCMYTHNIL